MPKQKMVKVGLLKPAPWNPDNRIKPGRLVPLLRSMDDIGQIQAIIVTDNNMIVEGHRRWACAKKLKWATMFAQVITEDQVESVKRIYSSVNYTLAKHSGNDTLGVWLKDPGAVRDRQCSRLTRIESVIGLPLMNRMYRAGLSASVFSLAVRICRECDAEEPDKIVKLIEWLMRFKCTGQVRKVIEGGHDPHIIMKAVNTDKTIKLKLEVA